MDQFVDDTFTLREITDVNGAKTMIARLKLPHEDAYTALSYIGAIYVGHGGAINGTGGTLFQEVSDLVELGLLPDDQLTAELQKRGFSL